MQSSALGAFGDVLGMLPEGSLDFLGDGSFDLISFLGGPGKGDLDSLGGGSGTGFPNLLPEVTVTG